MFSQSEDPLLFLHRFSGEICKFFTVCFAKKVTHIKNIILFKVTVTHNKQLMTYMTLKVLSSQNLLKLYCIFMVDDGLNMPSSSYDSLRAINVSILLVENIINTLSGSCLVYKMALCLCFYLQTINMKWLVVHMSGNMQSVWKWLWAMLSPSHTFRIFTAVLDRTIPD